MFMSCMRGTKIVAHKSNDHQKGYQYIVILCERTNENEFKSEAIDVQRRPIGGRRTRQTDGRTVILYVYQQIIERISCSLSKLCLKGSYSVTRHNRQDTILRSADIHIHNTAFRRPCTINNTAFHRQCTIHNTAFRRQDTLNNTASR